MSLLEVTGLCKSFGGLMAVNNVDFAVNQGDILGLIGPNGSGKTTVYNLVTGFLKPNKGDIRFEGESIVGAKPYRLCRMGIARTFQLAKPFAEMTVLEHLIAGRLYGRDSALSIRQAKPQAEEILELIGFRHKSGEIAEKLGLIERKTLELGRALATRPKLLLLDELMAGLNPVEIEAVMQLIGKIRSSGISIVLVEHVMKAVLGISDRVVVLSAGEKITEGTPQEVTANRQVIEAYLGEQSSA